MSGDKLAAEAALEMIAVEMGTRTAWDGELANKIAEIVTKAGHQVEAPAAPPTVTTAPELVLTCPNCGVTDPERFEVRETYHTYHQVDEIVNGTLVLTNATTEGDNEHISDGENDYAMICKECSHEDDPARFGAPHDLEWEWE